LTHRSKRIDPRKITWEKPQSLERQISVRVAVLFGGEDCMPNGSKTAYESESEDDADKLKSALEYLRDEAIRMDLGLVAGSIEKALQILKACRPPAKKEKVAQS
jgi:hypothetical protein